jgi:CubicO group peptidase (beta-lactamase class C family)
MITAHEGRCDIGIKEARYDEKMLERMHAHYAGLVESGKIQAAGYLLARSGKIFAHRTMGKLSYKPGSRPFLPESIKGIASITKVFTAAAIMQLVERGVLWLEQPVKTIIPEFDTPMHSDIKLCHLLTHTSGLPADPGYFSEPYPIDWFGILNRENWIKTILSGPMQANPGEQWNYCTLGYMILGEIVSRVSGRHFTDYMKDEIFAPLGLARTFIEVPDALASEVCFADAEAEKWFAKRQDRSIPASGGGIYSTLGDLFRFGQCFMNCGQLDGNRILGKKTVAEMTRNQLNGVPAFHWGKRLVNFPHGLGWEFWSDGRIEGEKTYSHEGWGWCSLFIDPVEEFIFVSMVADPTGWNPDVMVKPRVMAFAGVL